MPAIDQVQSEAFTLRTAQALQALIECVGSAIVCLKREKQLLMSQYYRLTRVTPESGIPLPAWRGLRFEMMIACELLLLGSDLHQEKAFSLL